MQSSRSLLIFLQQQSHPSSLGRLCSPIQGRNNLGALTGSRRCARCPGGPSCETSLEFSLHSPHSNNYLQRNEEIKSRQTGFAKKMCPKMSKLRSRAHKYTYTYLHISTTWLHCKTAARMNAYFLVPPSTLLERRRVSGPSLQTPHSGEGSCHAPPSQAFIPPRRPPTQKLPNFQF